MDITKMIANELLMEAVMEMPVKKIIGHISKYMTRYHDSKDKTITHTLYSLKGLPVDKDESFMLDVVSTPNHKYTVKLVIEGSKIKQKTIVLGSNEYAQESDIAAFVNSEPIKAAVVKCLTSYNTDNGTKHKLG
jgi:hypothetical protein